MVATLGAWDGIKDLSSTEPGLRNRPICACLSKCGGRQVRSIRLQTGIRTGRPTLPIFY